MQTSGIGLTEFVPMCLTTQLGEYRLAKQKKTRASKAQIPKEETPMDKTTRIVRKMIEEEDEVRQAKNDRLRYARLEREANIAKKPRKRP